MTSKMVTLRQKKGRAVEAALQTHGTQVVQTLTEQLTPLVAEGEAVPELSPVLTRLHRLLSQRRQNLVDIDEAHVAELAIGEERRQQRDGATENLIHQVMETRRLLEGTFGRKEATRITGLSGRTERKPLAVLRQAERLVGRLTDPAVDLPEEVHGGVQIDPLAVAEEMRPPLEALRSALDDLDRYQREREITLVAKARTLQEFDATLAPISLVVEGLLRLSGQVEFADRLRAFPRRPSPTEAPVESGESDGAAADGEASAGGGEDAAGEAGAGATGGDLGGDGAKDSGAGSNGSSSSDGDGGPGSAGGGSTSPPTASGGAVTPAAPS